MMTPAGISGVGRSELARLLAGGRRFVTPGEASAVLGIDADTATKKLSRWAEYGWLRRGRRRLDIGVPLRAGPAGAVRLGRRASRVGRARKRGGWSVGGGAGRVLIRTAMGGQRAGG